jgi:hypothetical protein
MRINVIKKLTPMLISVLHELIYEFTIPITLQNI